MANMYFPTGLILEFRTKAIENVCYNGRSEKSVL